ncbi:MAG: bifunctional diguanylate cyclase/phosphodiesterase [Campylobacterota bacterium]|nr:bifunctional diguanylate cyclase/phosphodiesterase [Campylobacterota bacterium]
MNKFIHLEKRIFYFIVPFTLLVLAVLMQAGFELKEEKQQLQVQHLETVGSQLHQKITKGLLQQQESTTTIAIASTRSIVIKDDGKAIDIAESSQQLQAISVELARHSKLKKVWFQIYDANGESIYHSWNDQRGTTLLSSEKDLKVMLNRPQIIESITVGKYGLSFKTMMPVFEQKSFIGIVEVITFFDTMVETFTDSDEALVIVIDKRFQRDLAESASNYYIDGYNIVNPNVLPDGLLQSVEKIGIESLIDASAYLDFEDYRINIDTLRNKSAQQGSYLKVDDYLMVREKIKDSDHTEMAYFLMFKKHSSIEHRALDQLSYTLNIIFLSIVILVIFIATSFTLRYLYIAKLKETRISDALTGLPSKTRLLEILEEENKSDKKLLIVNINNFSNINIVYGFERGDWILKSVGQRFQSMCECRNVFRIEGDEFAILYDEHTDLIKTIKMIQNHFFTHPLKLGDFSLNLVFSYGAAEYEAYLFRDASFALKQAKNLGPNRYHIYDSNTDSLDQGARKEFIRMSGVLHKALESDEVVPYFQGIRDNKTGKITKFETLARIHHEGKVLNPSEFIEVAQTTGMITKVTKVLIDKAFAYMKKRPYTFSINITEEDLNHNYLSKYIQQKLHHHQMDPERVIIEILEGVSVGGQKNHMEQFKALKKMGLKLAIDDFGAEYSNFERVLELDVDFLKIDAKYIKDIDVNERSYEITKSIAYFAKNTNIPCIAEFVSSAEIQAVIEELGIEFSQGYHFSVPKEFIPTVSDSLSNVGARK